MAHRHDNDLIKAAEAICPPPDYAANLDRALPASEVRVYRTMGELEQAERLEKLERDVWRARGMPA
jgi:hypothetical protein